MHRFNYHVLVNVNMHIGNKTIHRFKPMCFCPGKDASLAYITGDFTESGLTDDVSSLSPLQVVALYDWLAFYWKNYHPVGESLYCSYNLLHLLGDSLAHRPPTQLTYCLFCFRTAIGTILQ